MNNEEGHINLQLQKLKQSILDVSQQKIILHKQPYSFHKQLEQKMKNNFLVSFDSNKEIDVLQAGDKKYLSKKRADKISQLSESLHIQQEDFKYLFMIATQANYYKLQYPGYYEKILEQIPKYPKNMFSSIEKDIHRTFPNQHPFQQALKNVLTAFAIRNPNLLYCQGMNYVVAYFLINSVSEQETFWILVCLVENILPDDYFKDLSTISITTQIFSDVLPYLFPDMGREMKNIGMDCSLFIVSWYVCLFTKGFINSVSAYLLTKLILERRNHSFGFVLLKLSLGVIAAILGRDEPFTFRPQFTAFRDKFELSVFEISLLEIKLGIQYVELNEQNFLKLEKHYRQKREQRHSEALFKEMKNKRFSLPICNTEYPLCLHRIEIERKLGTVSEVTINRNGYDISSQYIEDYFDNEPKKQSTCSIYSQIDDCLMYRHKHVCQSDLFENSNCSDLSQKMDGKISLRHDESFMLERQKIEAMQECSSSLQIEMKSMVERDDEKFRELSGFFVVDQDFKFGSQQDIEQNGQNKQQKLNEEGQIIRSSASLDEPFNLAQQLQKHQIEQDWIKNEEEFKTLEEIQKSELQNQNKQFNAFNEKNFIKVSQAENKNQTGQKINSQTNLSANKQENNFFNKQKIWNFFGKTWKKVAKIKQEQLNT